jgi:dihydrofolate reductase
MRKLKVFIQVSLDGYFTDAHGDMSWAHRQDAEWDAFAADNASGGGALLFGRVTYEMMASFWPTPAGRAANPVVAEHMGLRPKFVCSRTLSAASWQNTTLLKGELVSEVGRVKREAGPDIVILGSGSIVAQLSQARLIDAYQMVIVPIALGGGRTIFEGLEQRQSLSLVRTRSFKNGNVVNWYEREQTER